MTAEVISTPPASLNGNGLHPEPEDAPELLASKYIQYLPSIYRQDSFMGRFLHIFEDILGPIQDTVNRRADYFDPAIATGELIDLMASWLGASDLANLPDMQKRRLLSNSVRLNQLRGTRQGLRLALETVTGKRPYITEYSSGLVLGEDAVLGLNTALGQGTPLQISVVFNCNENEIDSALVNATIQRYKPAETVYTVAFVNLG